MADILDRILDKGLVIDAWIKVSLIGIEIVSVEARVVVASVETFLRYAQEISKLRVGTEEPKALGAGVKPAQHQLPSAQEIQHYLEEHGRNLNLDEVAAHFGTTREELAERVGRLLTQPESTERHP